MLKRIYRPEIALVIEAYLHRRQYLGPVFPQKPYRKFSAGKIFFHQHRLMISGKQFSGNSFQRCFILHHIHSHHTFGTSLGNGLDNHREMKFPGQTFITCTQHHKIGGENPGLTHHLFSQHLVQANGERRRIGPHIGNIQKLQNRRHLRFPISSMDPLRNVKDHIQGGGTDNKGKLRCRLQLDHIMPQRSNGACNGVNGRPAVKLGFTVIVIGMMRLDPFQIECQPDFKRLFPDAGTRRQLNATAFHCGLDNGVQYRWHIGKPCQSSRCMHRRSGFQAGQRVSLDKVNLACRRQPEIQTGQITDIQRFLDGLRHRRQVFQDIGRQIGGNPNGHRIRKFLEIVVIYGIRPR